MEWWQIFLVILGAIAVGILGGILFSYLFKRFLKGQFVRKHDIASVFEEQKPEAASLVEEQKPRAASMIEEQKPGATLEVEDRKRKVGISMVPLFSGKSIAWLAIGLTVGVMLGLGYWAISPAIGEIRMGWPPIEITEGLQTLYESTVDIRIGRPGSAYIDVKTPQMQGEY